MTPPSPAPDFAPLFLEGAKGPLFSIYHRVPEGVSPRGALLFAPPFAEEMNRSRRMVAEQAKRFAALGFHVLRPDLYGTGDSAGNFAEAGWDVWLGDLRLARLWLQEKSGFDVTLWGLRTGCLLASEAIQSGEGVDGLLLWQPVANGQVFLTQFLRLKIAAAMANQEPATQEKGPSTKALRQGLLDGESLEVAGYEISPDLARGLDASRLAKSAPPAGSDVVWLEAAQEAEAPLSPASQAVVKAWQQAGSSVRATTVAGPSFWAIEETTLVPAFWQASEEALLGS